MTARRGTLSAGGARRGTLRHVPVLLPEVLAALAPQPGQRFIDGTFGAGGCASALLDAAADIQVLAIDRDPAAVAAGRGEIDYLCAAAKRFELEAPRDRRRFEIAAREMDWFDYGRAASTFAPSRSPKK